ncbi:MAG: alkaline phosphatase family protein [Oscillospiraceae bacterium]|nr:alkaline phosphatase family protein [Oscillospiraceae bacterium]
MKLLYPDYKNCIANLACSILRYYGAEGPDNGTLPLADELLAKDYKNVVVLLLDGMGLNILERNLAPDGFFRRNLRGVYSSVFPPTTVAATTSLDSGLLPNQHGWLGWESYYKEIGKNVTVFLNTVQDTKLPAADYNVPWRFFPYVSVIDRLRAAGVEACYATPFEPPCPTSFDAICRRVGELCAQDGRKYIYAYWNEPDGTMHATGIASEKSVEKLQKLEKRTEALWASLSDTLLLITADHGQVDSDVAVITDYPDILDCLVRLPSIEPRALNLFVKDGCEGKLAAAFEAHFGDKFKLFTRAEVKQTGLFGTGGDHPRFDELLGDMLAVSTDNVTLFTTPRQIIGVHAGMTAEEMRIPLIAPAGGAR